MGGLILKSGKNCPEYQQDRFKNLNLKIFRTAMIKNIKKHNDCHYTGEGKYLYKIKLSDDNQSYELSRTKL
jgi:hypothetical protein